MPDGPPSGGSSSFEVVGPDDLPQSTAVYFTIRGSCTFWDCVYRAARESSSVTLHHVFGYVSAPFDKYNESDFSIFNRPRGLTSTSVDCYLIGRAARCCSEQPGCCCFDRDERNGRFAVVDSGRRPRFDCDAAQSAQSTPKLFGVHAAHVATYHQCRAARCTSAICLHPALAGASPCHQSTINNCSNT